LVDLQTICVKYVLGTWFSPNYDIRICLLVMQRSWPNNAIWILKSKKWRKWCVLNSLVLFNNNFVLPVFTIGTNCSNQMFYWSIYKLVVLNTAWKRDYLQIIIFVNFCSTCSVVELKTRLETWITIIDANGVNFFLLSYLITLMAYLCSQWAPNILIKYFKFDWQIYRLFVLNTVWEHDSLQMMIFVYVCSTCSVVELKTLFETWIAKTDLNGVYCFHLS
jgi:hypothetical protein